MHARRCACQAAAGRQASRRRGRRQQISKPRLNASCSPANMSIGSGSPQHDIGGVQGACNWAAGRTRRRPRTATRRSQVALCLPALPAALPATEREVPPERGHLWEEIEEDARQRAAEAAPPQPAAAPRMEVLPPRPGDAQRPPPPVPH